MWGVTSPLYRSLRRNAARPTGVPVAIHGQRQPGRRRRGFSGFTVPAGLYDPALDYQRQAASRGLHDLAADTLQNFGIQGGKTLHAGRAWNDYQLGLQQNTQDTGYSLGQLTTSRDRALADIATARGRAGQEHQRALDELNRRFSVLASNQRQAANASGMALGGALAQAAAKRRANESFQQKPIDTSYQNTLADLATRQGRVGEDYQTQAGRLNQLSARTAGGLGLRYQRGEQDAATQLARARRENRFYGQGIRQQKIFQAAQAGWAPPVRHGHRRHRRRR